jgi:hypothetical protein
MARKIDLRVRYALIGLIVVPFMGRLALAGTGHSGDLYRYLVPAAVGLTAGILIGWARTRYLQEHQRLLLAHQKLESEMNACMTAFSKLETSENKYREIFDSPIADLRPGR